jgi:hypothetical protein
VWLGRYFRRFFAKISGGKLGFLGMLARFGWKIFGGRRSPNFFNVAGMQRTIGIFAAYCSCGVAKGQRKCPVATTLGNTAGSGI